MKRTAPSFHHSKQSILIIDHTGILGKYLYQSWKDTNPLVYVSSIRPLSLGQETIFLPYKKLIPAIPNYEYSRIIFIWDGSLDSLAVADACIRKASQDAVPFFFITSYKLLRSSIYKRITQSYEKSFCVTLGDVFGDSSLETYIEELFILAHVKNRLLLPNTGLEHLHPVSLLDTLSFLIPFLSSLPSSNHVAVYPDYSLPEITFAHLLQKANPLLRVDFSPIQKEQQAQPLSPGTYLIQPSYPAKEKIQQYYDYLLTHPVAEDRVPRHKTKYRIRLGKISISGSSVVRSFCLFLLTLLLLPLITSATFFVAGVSLLSYSKNVMTQAKIAKAISSTQAAETLFVLSRFSATSLTIPAQSLGLSGLVDSFDKATLLGQTVSEGARTGLEAIHAIAQAADTSIAEKVFSLQNNLFSSIIAYEKTLLISRLPSSLTSPLKEVRDGVSLLSSLLPALPTLLGNNTEQTYLVLLQNNMELRPTGGFIGSYGILRVKQGALTSLTIHDVYDADGQLEGHIDPPMPLKQYMHTPHLFLRDSNFFIDFPTSASMAAFLLHKETNISVDGVIGVDITCIQKILQAIGPIYLPLYNQTVTEKNLFILTQSHVEKGFFPGSSQKKDFLRSLYTAISEKLSHASMTYAPLLSKKMLESIQEKHLLIASAHTSVEEILVANNIAGSLVDTRQSDANTFLDFLHINEANIGANKVNYYVQREVSHQVVLQNNALEETATITLHNTSTPQWLAGPYGVYLRVVVPQNAQLITITRDNREQGITKDVLPDNALVQPSSGSLQLTTTDEFHKRTFGFFVSIPTSSSTQILVRYKIPLPASLYTGLTYRMWYMKQPGVDPYKYTYSFSYPASGYAPTSIDSRMEKGYGEVTLQTKVARDTLFSFRLFHQ